MILSCDTGSAGAFFSQFCLDVPQEEMPRHTGEHVVVPAGVLPDFVVIHAKFCLAFLECLLNRPSQPTEPHEQSEARILGSITDEIGVLRLFADRAPDHQPDLPIGQVIFAESYSLPCEIIINGALGTLRHGSRGVLVNAQSAARSMRCRLRDWEWKEIGTAAIWAADLLRIWTDQPVFRVELDR